MINLEVVTSQQKAIYSTNKSVIVSASAGTGKTYTLINRVMHLLVNEKLNIWQLLAVTFTEKAAKELKDRIRTELITRFNETSDKTLAKHLLNNIYLLPLAQFSTIHSLCSVIIRENFSLINVSPRIVIIESLKQKKAKKTAWEKVCKKSIENSPQINMVIGVANWLCNGDLLRLFEPIEALDRFMMILSNDAQEKYISVLVDSYNLPVDKQCSVINALKLHLIAKLEKFYAQMNSLIVNPAAVSYLPWLLDWDSTLSDTITRVKSSENYTDLFCIFHDSQLTDQQCAQMRVKQKLGLAKDTINSVRKNFIEIKDTVFALHPKQLSELMQFNKELAEDYVSLWRLWRCEYQDYKQRENVIDFNDLEHYAYRLLAEYSSVREKYHSQFKAILVDEYQDTNPLQEDIISLLVDKSSDNSSTSLFRVGDVKQAIYSFRGAEPNIFNSHIKLSQVNKSHLVSLSDNRRSAKNILNFVNFMFDQLMFEENADTDYKNHHHLIQSPDTASNFAELPVEVWMLDHTNEHTESEEDNSQFETEVNEGGPSASSSLIATIEDLHKMELEGRMIATKLKEIVDNKKIQITLKSGESRSLQYCDCVILMRNMKTASALVRGLEALGVPVYAILRSGFVNSVEVRDALNLLRCIDNPCDDQALVGWLTSPAVGINIQELTDIVLINSRSGDTPLYFRVTEYIEKYHDGVSDRLKKSCAVLEELRELLHLENPATLMNLALHRSGLMYAAQLSPFANQKLANLKLLLDMAEEYTSEPGVGLRGLLEYYTELTRSDELGPAPAIGEGENVVRVMSVHQSKGLEFPLVIVANTSQSFNLSNQRGLTFSNEFGMTASLVDAEFESYYKTPVHELIRTGEKKKMLAEELRILYVALTRAQHKLIITGNCEPREVSKIFYELTSINQFQVIERFLDCKSELYWILWALTQSPNLNAVLNEKLDIEVELNENTFQKYPFLIELSWLHPDQIEFATPQQPDYKLPEFHASETKINLPIGFIVDNFPAKMNVTDIIRAGEDENADLLIPARIYRGSTDGQRIGSIYHKVFELLPLNEQLDSPVIVNQLIQNIDENILSSVDKNEVDPNLVSAFFLTELGKYITANPHRVKRELSLTYAPPVTSNYSLATIVQGRLDMMVQDSHGNWIIVDFKTDQEVDEEKIQHYKKQLAVYAEMIERATGRQVSATYLYFVRQGTKGLVKLDQSRGLNLFKKFLSIGDRFYEV